LKILIQQLKKIHGSDAVAVTASTGTFYSFYAIGIAAYNIGGCTLHSFAGMGLAKGPKEKIVGAVYGNKKTLERWKATQVLIIDEISMVDGDFFDTLEYVGRNVRNSQHPFGGIQVGNIHLFKISHLWRLFTITPCV
jgi:ATP-dependent DNA helicase PIF1